MSMIKTVVSPTAPKPAGHYSHAVVHNGVVYLAGQLGVDPAKPGAPAGSIEAQTEQALKNIKSILEASGSDLDHVLQMTVFVTDMALWAKVNEAFARVMGHHRPARAVVPVKDFRDGYQVEIQSIAAVRAG